MLRKKSPSLFKSILAALAASFLAYGLLCLLLPASSNLRLQVGRLPSALAEPRLSGLDTLGGTSKEFHFSEPRVMSRGAVLEIFCAYEDGRPGDALILKLFGSESRIPIGKEGNIISLNDPAHLSEPISFSIGIPESGAGEKARRLKLSAIRIKPIGSLLFPVLGAAWPVMAGVFLLTLSISILLGWGSGLAALVPPAAVQFLLWGLLRRAPLESWDQAGWFMGAAAVLVCGLLLGTSLYGNSRRDPSREAHSSELAILIFVLLLMFSVWVRHKGLMFGHPLFYHPDEARKVQVSERILRSDDLDPKYFRHPNMLVYGMAFSAKAYSWLFSTPIEPLLLSACGRTLSLLSGIGACLLVFFIAHRLYGWFAGLVAMGIAAGSPLLVVTSRYTKEDSLLLFFTLLAAYFAVRALDQRNSRRDLLLSAFFAGLSASAKYSGIVNLLMPGFVLLAWSTEGFLGKFRHGRPSFIAGILPLGIAAAALFGLGFLIVTPYAILTPAKFLADFNKERVHMERGHAGAISAGQFFWMYHLRFSLLPALDWPGLVLAIVGVGLLIYRRRAEDLFLLVCLLIFYLPAEWVKAKPEPQPERYVVPCAALFAVFAGAAAAEAPAFLSRSGIKGLLRPIIFVSVFLPLAVFSAGHALSLSSDTRAEAASWINEHIPAGSRIVIDWGYYGPHLPREKYEVIELKIGRGVTLLNKFSPQKLKAEGVRYVVLSELYYRRFLKPSNRFHPQSWRIRAFMSTLKPIKEFSRAPYDYGFHNPDIKIYDLG